MSKGKKRREAEERRERGEKRVLRLIPARQGDDGYSWVNSIDVINGDITNRMWLTKEGVDLMPTYDLGGDMVAELAIFYGGRSEPYNIDVFDGLIARDLADQSEDETFHLTAQGDYLASKMFRIETLPTPEGETETFRINYRTDNDTN